MPLATKQALESSASQPYSTPSVVPVPYQHLVQQFLVLELVFHIFHLSGAVFCLSCEFVQEHHSFPTSCFLIFLVLFRIPVQTFWKKKASRAPAQRPLVFPPQIYSSCCRYCSNSGSARSRCLHPSVLSLMLAGVPSRCDFVHVIPLATALPRTPFASLLMPIPIPVHPKCSRSSHICTHTLALESTVVLIHHTTSPSAVHNVSVTNFILPVLVSHVPCLSPRPSMRRGTFERTSGTSSLPQDFLREHYSLHCRRFPFKRKCAVFPSWAIPNLDNKNPACSATRST